ncbi:hypothetical protein PLICRDRAFT_284973 [Plicaturopsis crispa FD-325 SS-3]|nr:hypothetical protein PLICRDRAFT_284973 [Plicaturopsis crispa FD-325 SS-3]
MQPFISSHIFSLPLLASTVVFGISCTTSAHESGLAPGTVPAFLLSARPLFVPLVFMYCRISALSLLKSFAFLLVFSSSVPSPSGAHPLASRAHFARDTRDFYT